MSEFTEFYPECNHMEPFVKYKDENKLITREIIIVINRFGLLKR